MHKIWIQFPEFFAVSCAGHGIFFIYLFIFALCFFGFVVLFIYLILILFYFQFFFFFFAQGSIVSPSFSEHFLPGGAPVRERHRLCGTVGPVRVCHRPRSGP